MVIVIMIYGMTRSLYAVSFPKPRELIPIVPVKKHFVDLVGIGQGCEKILYS